MTLHNTFRLNVTDDRAFHADRPYTLLVGLPFESDRAPVANGKWWTVTITRAPGLTEPVTFFYTLSADAALLLAKITARIQDLTRITSQRIKTQ